ncbi:hypothetical protein [Flavobacterium sp. UBA6135]|uniref:hypothetical protein n=1 Tax=Flavobacterium sp. UBA6135 TaxID=1946553 RepID=UPI0025C2D746|nr:hypothetical protein [Flavobacterium sp. UBA6135]
MKKVKIHSVEELKKFILENDIQSNDIRKLLASSLKVWICEFKTKEELLLQIDELLLKYQDVKNRPLFVDIPNDKIKVSDFVETVF